MFNYLWHTPHCTQTSIQFRHNECNSKKALNKIPAVVLVPCHPFTNLASRKLFWTCLSLLTWETSFMGGIVIGEIWHSTQAWLSFMSQSLTAKCSKPISYPSEPRRHATLLCFLKNRKRKLNLLLKWAQLN